jgi:hypothetical protein
MAVMLSLHLKRTHNAIMAMDKQIPGGRPGGTAFAPGSFESKLGWPGMKNNLQNMWL